MNVLSTSCDSQQSLCSLSSALVGLLLNFPMEQVSANVLSLQHSFITRLTACHFSYSFIATLGELVWAHHVEQVRMQDINTGKDQNHKFSLRFDYSCQVVLIPDISDQLTRDTKGNFDQQNGDEDKTLALSLFLNSEVTA